MVARMPSWAGAPINIKFRFSTNRDAVSTEQHAPRFAEFCDWAYRKGVWDFKIAQLHARQGAREHYKIDDTLSLWAKERPQLQGVSPLGPAARRFGDGARAGGRRPVRAPPRRGLPQGIPVSGGRRASPTKQAGTRRLPIQRPAAAPALHPGLRYPGADCRGRARLLMIGGGGAIHSAKFRAPEQATRR